MVKDKYSLIVNGKEEAQIVYEDELFLAIITEDAIAAGQVTILPKEKHTIFEMVPDSVLSKLGVVIKIVSSAVFESLKCHGTNVMIENGVSAGQEVPYFSVQIIPRNEDDGIKLDWVGEDLEEFDLENTYLQMKAQIDGTASAIMDKELAASGDAIIEEDEMDEDFDDGPEKDNYLLKSLRKIP